MFEAERLKRITTILLVVVLAQFLGLKGLCSSASQPAHDCCPPSQERPAESSSPLPDCCIATAAREQGAISETRADNESVSKTLQIEEHTLPGLLPPAPAPLGGCVAFSQPVSQIGRAHV